MREEMRARAVLLLQSERAETAPPADPVTPAQARQDAPAPVCAACGAPSQSGDRFCAQCGAPLSCPGCDAPLRAGDRFCSRCGHALAASEPPSA
jgi:predicted amidophosphoribosyltransferase